MNNKHIIPTKEHPVFIAHCDDYGFIESDDLLDLDGDEDGWFKPTFKNFMVENKDDRYGGCGGSTFATNLPDAIAYLFTFISKYKAARPDTLYKLYYIDGSWDKKVNSYKRKRIYRITEKQAKRYKVKL